MEKVNVLPYGRNSDRADFKLVEIEKKGTCSTKHAFLKYMADKNEVENVELLLCMFKLSGKNSPKISDILLEFELEYIPEAHCFIKIDFESYDITFPNSNRLRVEGDILESQFISPHQIGDYKLQYHKDYLRKWIIENKINLTFKELWKIRESCISRLSEN